MATFPRCRRLLTQREFRSVFRTATRSRDAIFTVLAVPNQRRCARLGLAISRKTDRRAVVRNRIKRQVRESFRHSSLPALDVVVISQPKAAVAHPTEIRTSLERHWTTLTRRADQGRH